MKEKWKDLKFKDIKPIYQISTYGGIKNKNSGKLVKGSLTRKGYVYVCLQTEKGQGTFKLHRLVCISFKLYKHKDKDTVNHIDGNKLNNRLDNLEWADQTEQIIHAYKNNLIKKRKGPELYNNKYDEEFIYKICELIDNGITKPTDICNILGINYYKQFKYLIYDIKHGKSWKYISKDFKFMEDM